MKEYELAVLLHPDLEIDLEAPLARLDGIFKSAKAKVIKRDEWGKRKLAYNIKGQSFAVYIFYILEMDPTQISSLERSLRLSDEVLRHQVVVYVPPVADDDEEEEKKDNKEDGDGA